MLVRDWRPALPDGTLRSVVLHWTAGDYESVYPAYHFCLTGAADVFVHATHDLRANMRDVRGNAGGDYAAHTAGRNSFAVGIAVCGMLAATPQDFGAFGLRAAQIDALCAVAAGVIRRYGIAISQVRTHAEAAIDDGYFGAGDDEQRWDIARLTAAEVPLGAPEALATGARLRARIGMLA